MPSSPQPSTSQYQQQKSQQTAKQANISSPSTDPFHPSGANEDLLQQEPQPGPSTNAAEFDLEIFDSGSSCSLEDCWTSSGGNVVKKCGKKLRRSSKKFSSKLTRSSLSNSTSGRVEFTEAEEEEGEGSDTSVTSRVPSVSSDEIIPISTLVQPIDMIHIGLKEPPESACPSETEEAASEKDDEEEEEEEEEEKQGQEGGRETTISHCPNYMGDLMENEVQQRVDNWACSSIPSTSNSLSSSSSVSQTASTSSGNVENNCNNENIEEIVNDHDNFGTDENEDSLDSISLDLNSPQTQNYSLSSFKNDSGEVMNKKSVPMKRKSTLFDNSLYAVDLGCCNVKKQCILEPNQTLEISTGKIYSASSEGKISKREDTDCIVVNEKEHALAVQSNQAKNASPDITKETTSTTTVTVAAPISSASPTFTASNIPTTSAPDPENPPVNVMDWLDTFNKWSHKDKLVAIDSLINVCHPTQVRHMMAVIEPQFQRDFISFLPKELALYVLSFLNPRDLLRAAQTCRYWRILCEDNLLWREKCREANLVDDFKEVMRLRVKKSSSSFPYSAWKSSFMRQHNIEMNWRVRNVRLPKILKGHDDHVITCLQFSSNKIVSGSDDNTLKVWSALSGKCLRTLVGHTGGVWSSQMEDNVIVSGSTDRTLKVWDVEKGTCVHTLYGHTSTVRCMHLHKNRVVSGSRDATIRMWDISSGECLHVLVGHVAAVRCVQYDGRLVVSGAYDYMVKVWNPETEECLHTLAGHTNRVYSLQFDGVHVVSGSLDTSIRVWDVETGACKHALMGHQSLTSGMELRNNILVSGNADSTVKVWDITNGQCLQTLSGPNKHQSAVTCLQFNAKFVITSSDDGTVKLWDVKTGEFIRDLIALESGGSGGVVWRIRANPTKLVCAVGSRNGTEETKLLVLDFDDTPAGAKGAVRN